MIKGFIDGPRFFLVLCAAMLGSEAFSQDFRIAYNIYDSVRKDYEVYIMQADGSGKKNLTNRKAVDWTYYSNGGKIYFISDRDTCYRCFFLYEMDAGGGSLRKLSALQLEDSWMGSREVSREGGREMVVSARDGDGGRFQLYLLNTLDGSYRRLTADTSAYHNDPVFIQEGRQIVYRYKSRRTDRQQKTELWIMDADGGNRRQLTFYPSGDTSAPWYAYHAGPPRWNARYGFISYQSLRQGAYHIYAITPDGKKQWQLTYGEGNEGWHDWSADGRWLVTDVFDREQKEFDIALYRYGKKMRARLLTGKQSWRLEQAPVIVK